MALALLLGPGSTSALASEMAQVLPLPLNAQMTPDGRSVELNWVGAQPPRVGNVAVFRRDFGQTGGETWNPIAPQHGPKLRFLDRTTQPGIAYEYRVQRTARQIVDVGYWITGRSLPAKEQRGTAYIVVDETLEEPLSKRLARLKLDLLGDGWRVRETKVPRHDSQDTQSNLRAASGLRGWLRDQFLEDPFGLHAAILVGHVPIVMSGRAAPDGHEAVAHATDLFYADVDGSWRATEDLRLVENQIPGSHVELQIGRIDLSTQSAGDSAKEIALTRRYLDKVHNWRHARHGEIRAAYGTSNHLMVERFGLRNIVGPGAVREGGHHDAGEEQPWLWGVDFGDWNGSRYASDHRIKAIFTINFGSGKHKFERQNNAMGAMLAQPWYPISVGWGGRPAWWLHPMALGSTIGEVHFRSVNNGRIGDDYPGDLDYFPTGQHVMINVVWMNLLGDPTTHAFPLHPPSGLAVELHPDGAAQLTWQASLASQTIGYAIYRAEDPQADFVRISGNEPIFATTFADPTGSPNAVYMVRAYGLMEVYAGSFYTYSQGIFGRAGETAASTLPVTVATPSDRPVRLQPSGQGKNGELGVPAIRDDLGTPSAILSFVHGPDRAQGDLTLNEDGSWEFIATPGYVGSIQLPYSIFDGITMDVGAVTIQVDPPIAPIADEFGSSSVSGIGQR